MDGLPDEFCLVEPLTSLDDESQELRASQQSGDIIFAHFDQDAPGTPISRLPGTPVPNGACNAVPSVLADDELWGPPAGARRPYQCQQSRGNKEAAKIASGAKTLSPPWRESANNCGVGTDDEEEEEEVMSVDDLMCSPRPAGSGAMRVGGVGFDAVGVVSPGAPGAGVHGTTPSPRRKRTSGIHRERQFGGGVSRMGGRGSGRRRGGPGNGKGGLSKKTLNIVTNLGSHTTGVRSREEIEEAEEEKRLAEEERKFKENLRQKGDDFEHTIRILLLGDSGVGKTSLMTRFSEDKFAPTMISTAGVDFKVQTLEINGKRIKCQIWDTAGQEKFHVITRAYYRGAHGIALVYDVTDSDSFKNVNYWMANIQTHAEHGQRIQKMILGNKIDIEERTMSSKDGEDVAKEFGIRFFEVSAKNGVGVSDAFRTLAVDIVQAVGAVNRTVEGDEQRRTGRMFGSGAARLRSLASRKPTFLTSRKGSGAKGARMSRKESGKRAAAKTEQSDSEAGDLETRSASERCKVS